jgi:hypothetical protein
MIFFALAARLLQNRGRNGMSVTAQKKGDRNQW